MIADAIAALRQIASPPFRAVLWKSLGFTLLLLALVWVGLDRWANGAFVVATPWLGTLIAILTGIGLFVGAAFLVAPISSLVAGFYFDEMADLAERDCDPAGHGGTALPAGRAVTLSARFALVSLAVNFVALLVFLLPGVNILVFFVANAYLLGREYFELAALRYRPLEEVRILRRKHAVMLFVCGLFIAAFVAVPIVNLLTPLFGTAFMVRMHKRLTARPG